MQLSFASDIITVRHCQGAFRVKPTPKVRREIYFHTPRTNLGQVLRIKLTPKVVGYVCRARKVAFEVGAALEMLTSILFLILLHCYHHKQINENKLSQTYFFLYPLS